MSELNIPEPTDNLRKLARKIASSAYSQLYHKAWNVLFDYDPPAMNGPSYSQQGELAQMFIDRIIEDETNNHLGPLVQVSALPKSSDSEVVQYALMKLRFSISHARQVCFQRYKDSDGALCGMTWSISSLKQLPLCGKSEKGA
jgi:hypothetical protein